MQRNERDSSRAKKEDCPGEKKSVSCNLKNVARPREAQARLKKRHAQKVNKVDT